MYHFKVPQTTVCVKRNAHLIPNFLWPLWGREAKDSHGRLHNRPCEFLAHLPQGGHKKIGIKCVFLLTQTVKRHLCKLYLRMYCIGTEASVFMFNRGSCYGFTIHPMFTNHINNEKHMYHGFLAPRAYLQYILNATTGAL